MNIFDGRLSLDDFFKKQAEKLDTVLKSIVSLSIEACGTNDGAITEYEIGTDTLEDMTESLQDLGINLTHGHLSEFLEAHPDVDRTDIHNTGITVYLSESGIMKAKAIKNGEQQYADTDIPVKTQPQYLIWAESKPDDLLKGGGYLRKNGKLMTFPTRDDAEIFIKDLESLCLNNTPSASFGCIENPGRYTSERRMDIELIKSADMTPSFDPNNFEVKNQCYGTTGGGCMVATVGFYLPELDKSIWMNSNEESISIASADFVWNEDGSDSYDRPDDVMLYHTEYNQKLPEDIEHWLPMIHKTLEYTIEQECAHYRNGYTFSLPVAWLPDSIKNHVEPEYLSWLQENEKEIKITKGSQVVEDEGYNQTPADMQMQ